VLHEPTGVVTGSNQGRAGRPPRKRRTVSQTRRAEGTDASALKREVARLRRENHLLRSQLRTKTPIPRSTVVPRRGAVTPGSLRAHDIVADRYELDKLLARGGMGAVWVARDMRSGQRVALKFLKGEAGPEHVARFEREAEVCKRLQSPHVVRVIDHGVDGGNHYLAMELLRGESLSSLLRRKAKLELSECCQLAMDIADALGPAHEAGIVHRDLKPQNLFISIDREGNRTLKLLDFGVAKELDDTSDMTSSGVIIGSPNYMSPEQARGMRRIDHRSDLWSVAVVLYRLLTGKRPWEGDQALDLLLKVCTEPAPPPSSHDPQLSRRIDAFFERAFAKAPHDRFDSARELANAFVRASKSHSAPPPVRPSMHSPVPSERGSLVPLLEAPTERSSLDEVPPSRHLTWWILILAIISITALGAMVWMMLY
jgi:serine/threonine-protein kinase